MHPTSDVTCLGRFSVSISLWLFCLCLLISGLMLLFWCSGQKCRALIFAVVSFSNQLICAATVSELMWIQPATFSNMQASVTRAVVPWFPNPRHYKEGIWQVLLKSTISFNSNWGVCLEASLVTQQHWNTSGHLYLQLFEVSKLTFISESCRMYPIKSNKNLLLGFKTSLCST